MDNLDVDGLRRTMTAYREALHTHAERLNRLNVYPVADGDTGTNMALTIEAVVREVDTAPATMAATCAAIGHGSLMGARGNSGVILSQVLRGLTSGFVDADAVNATQLALGLQQASAAAYQAVLRPVEGTILTVVRESAEGAAARTAGAGATVVDVVDAARDAGARALERTPELLPVLREAGVVDAGAAGFLLFYDAALSALTGAPLPSAAREEGEGARRHPVGAPERYEVMYLLDLPDDRIEGFRHACGALGDSIVVVGGDGVWTCHVHTDDVDGAIEAARAAGGRPHDIRVTDLRPSRSPT